MPGPELLQAEHRQSTPILNLWFSLFLSLKYFKMIMGRAWSFLLMSTILVPLAWPCFAIWCLRNFSQDNHGEVAWGKHDCAFPRPVALTWAPEPGSALGVVGCDWSASLFFFKTLVSVVHPLSPFLSYSILSFSCARFP